MDSWIKGMRDFFFQSLFDEAKKNRNVILITADTGAICHDKFKKELSEQYINVGIAEQDMIGVAAGLTMSGKIVYVYAITPFATMRCYEQIRVDLCCMELPVSIVGIGAGLDYSTLGATHHGTEDIALMRLLPAMEIYSPSDNLTAGVLAKVDPQRNKPRYIRLDRTGFPAIYKDENDIDFSKGFSTLKQGKDLYIIATGRMVYKALEIAEKLSDQSISTGVIDLFRIKPFNEKMVWSVIKHAGHLVTLEEHFITGGIGSLVSSMVAVKEDAPLFKPIGIPDQFCKIYGEREYLQKAYGLDADSVEKSIKEWIKK